MKKFSTYLMLIMFFATLGLGVFALNQKQDTNVANALPTSSTYATRPSGSGTESQPYLIKTGDELAWVAQQVNSGSSINYVKLANNIELGTKIWTPIGTGSNSFTGNFDGDGYTIKNLLIDSTIETHDIGLFGTINGGTVQNLVVENAFILTSGYSYDSDKSIGVVAGKLQNSATIRNVAVIGGYVKYIGNNSEGTNKVAIGGIAGRVSTTTGTPKIENSFSSVNISNPGSDESYTKKSSLGGIVGYNVNSNLTLTNVYFTGKITYATSSSMDAITAGSSAGKKVNVYYAYTKATYSNGSITEKKYAGYWNVSQQSVVSNSEYTTELSSTIVNINIYNAFDDTSSSDRLRCVDENWIKEDGKYPVLRGVGNRVVAIKIANSYVDLDSNIMNSNKPVRLVQSLSDSSTMSLELHIGAAELTWDTYTRMRRLSGTYNNMDISTSDPNPNRLQSLPKTLSVVPTDQQGYYVFEITTTSLLHEYSFVVQDRYAWNATQNQHVATDKPGRLRFQNLGKSGGTGEVYYGVTTTNRGTKVDVNSWSAPIDFAVGSPVKVFVSKDTKVRVEAVIRTSASSSTVDTKYHSMNIFASNSNFSSRIDNQEKTFIASNENQNLQAGLIDLYKFTFDKDELFAKKNSSNQDTNNLYENVDREPKPYYTNLASGLQDFGGKDTSAITSSPYIYLSYNTGRAFIENQNGTFSERTTNIFPVPEAAGYEFSGWFSQDKTVRFSHGKSNYFNNNQTRIRALMKTTNQTIDGGNYPVCQNTTLYGVWTLKEHTIEFVSVLNLDETVNWNQDTPPVPLMEMGNYLLEPEQTYWINSEDKARLGMRAINTAIGYTGTVKALTNSGADIFRVTDGYGYGLRAIILKDRNGNFYSQDSYRLAPATFAQLNGDPFIQSVYYSIFEDGQSYTTLFNVFSDLMVIAIFDIGTGRVNVEFSPNKPSTMAPDEKTGLEFQYQVYNRNNELVRTGTVNETNPRITYLSPLHYVVVTNMTVNGSKFAFSDNEERRFQWDTSLYEIDLQTPSDHGEPGKWIFKSLVGLNTTFFDQDVEILLNINIKYLGFSFSIMQGYYDSGGQFRDLPTNPNISDQFANFYLVHTQGSQAIINGNLAENVRPDAVFELSVSNQKLWKVAQTLQILVFEQGSTSPVSASVKFEKTSNKFKIYDFKGFQQDKQYLVYVVMEKVQYTLEISKQNLNPAYDQYIDVYLNDSAQKLVFNSGKAYVYVTFDQIFKLNFQVNYLGYSLTNITVLNKAETITNTQQHLINKALYNIDPNAEQIGSLTSIVIKVSVEPKKTYYIIEYYKESLTQDGVFELVNGDSDVVENIMVGTTVTISVDQNRYTGFSYFKHENEILTTQITYHEADEALFRVYYKANTYTILYNGNGHTGGSAPQNQQIKFGRTLTVATNSYTKTGHSFLHWNKSPNDLGTAKYTEGNQVVVNEEFIASANDNQVILYAIWQAKTIQIVFSSPDSGTVSSSQWTNRVGYTVYSNQTNAVALVTFGKQYGYIKNPADNTYIQKTDLIIPVRAGYIFKEWQKQDGTTVTAQTIVDVDQTITLYAVWEPKQVKVWYHSNLGSSGVSVKLSFDNKNLNTESKFGDFPTITWLSTQVFDLVGWSLDAAKSGSIVYLNADTPLPQGQDEIHVYAHWTPSTPELNDAPWSIILTYNGAKQRTLEVGTNATYDKYITNAATSGSGIVYRYSWSKAGTPVAGENSSYLMLKNVADSGFYTVEVYAYHTIWGSSLIASATGEVIINRADLRVNVAKVGGKITKTYDHTTNITGVTTTNTGVLRATAKFKNANAATGITVIFTATFITDDPNNYNVYYEDGTENLNVDFKTAFDFYDTGDITPYNLTVSIGNRSGYANGLKHKVNASLISMSGQDSSFLGSAGHVLTGYVETADAVAGVYTGTGLVNFLQVSNQDITENYNITINGTYQIVESVLKTLVINKTALLNKDNSVAQSISPTEKFVLRYGVHDISQTNVYNIDGTYFNIVNDPNSNQIIISSDEDFSGSISIIPNAFTHTVGTTITQVVAYKWIAQGKDDVFASSLEFSFALIGRDQQQELTVVYINHSKIIYNARIVETPVATQTIYNTSDGILTSHPAALDITSQADIDTTGLVFEGWYMGTSASAPQAPTLWKGYGDIVVYAKWSLESPQILVKNDDVEIQYSVIRTYDGKAHYLSHQVENSNALYITYSHSWKVGTQTKTDAFYYYKNVTEETITLSVTAQLFYGATLYQTKTTTKQINLKVNQFEFFFDKVEKVFDGNANIASADGNYILVDIDLGEVVETLRLTGRYTSRFVGTNIELENTKLEKHSSFEPTNFKLTVAPGTITPKALVNVDLGEPEQNTKSYDTTPFVFTKERATSISLVSGHVLDITVKTIDFKVGTYTAEQNQILVLSWQVYDGSEDVTNCYTLESIIGGAQIVKQNSLNTAEITFSNTNAVYNGKQQFLYANTDLFAGGKIPSDVSLVYTWQKQGSATTYTYTEHGGPIEVGEYLIFLTVVADPDNYNINGVNPLEARLTILARTVTLNLLTNTFEGVNQPIDVDTKLGTHQVDRLELAQGHYMQGYVTTNSSLPNTYTQNAGNLVSNLAIYDAQGNDVSHNYQIKIDGSIILINYYFIEYRPGLGNGAIQKQQVNYGQEVFLLANSFVRDGYTYSHWNTQIDGSGTSFAEREVVLNLAGHNQTFVLYPAWNASTNTKYYVEYYLENQDGTFDEQANFEEFYISTTEYKIELVPHIISDNLVSSYDFVVYDKETLVTITVFNKQYEGFTNAVVEDLSVLSGFVTPASQGSLRLKLYFKRNSYTLTLFKNNFESPDFISTPYLFEQLIDEPTQPTRSGYNFVGWYINYPGPTSYMVTWPFEMPAKNVDLWAIYTANPNTAYVLEYYEQNANGSYPSQPTRVENFAGTTDTYAFIEIEQTDGVITSAVLRVYDTEDKQNKVGTDYVFNISPTGMHMIMHPSQILSGKITASPTLALKVYYERNMYELTRVLHNGQANITTTHRYGEQVSQPTAPSYIGYVFDGWYLNFNETTGVYTNPLSWPLTISNNRTIHAKWKADANTQYTVYVYLENLDGTFNQTPDSTKTLTNTTNYYAEFNPVGNVIEVYTDASKQTHVATESGFTYLGFNLDVESSTISTTIKPDGSGEIVLYLLRNTYTVEFVYNNGQPNSTSEPVKYEQTINKPADPTRTGYVFAGWYLDEALTKAVTWPYAVKSSGIVMYAKWDNATNTPYKIETYKQDAQGEYPETPEVENFVGTTGHYVAIEQDTVGEVLIWNLKVYTNSSKSTLVEIIKSIEIEGYTFNQNGEVIEKAIAADGSMVIKLYYTLNSYIFTIEPNNGQEQQTQSVKFGQKPIMPTAPILTGYDFEAWYLDELFEKLFDINSFRMPAHNVTIYAKWKPSENTQITVYVYFENLDGTHNSSADITKVLRTTTNYYAELTQNGVVEIFTDSTKQTLKATHAGFVYIGFYLDEQNSVLSTTVKADSTGEIVLYLLRNTYTVEFVYNNGQPNSTSEPVKYEQTINKPSDPTRTGYVFAGWHLDEALTKAVTWPYAVTANVVMFAKWNSATDTPYTIEIYKQLPSGEYDEPIVEQHKGTTNHFVAVELDEDTQTWNINIYIDNTKSEFVETIKNIEIEGYTFNQNGEVIERAIAADGSMVIKLYYTLNSYIFTIEPNNGQEQQTQSVKFGQKPIMPTDLTRTGYVFDGWYLDQTFTTVFQLQSFAMPAHNVTIYAKWKPSENTQITVYVYFENLDGSFNTIADIEKTLQSTTNFFAQFSKQNNAVEIFTDSTKQTLKATHAGFVYIGFYLDEQNSVLSTTVKADSTGEIVLYLLRNTYTVEFVYNNGQPNETLNQIKYEQPISKPIDPEKIGYVFAGWYLNPTFTQVVSWPFIVTANTVMYAKWNNATDTPYKIETYKQDAQGEYPETPEVENFVGTTGHYVAIEQDTVGEVLIWNLKVYTNSSKSTLVEIIKSIEIEGYTFNQNGEVIEKAIAADGSMVIKLYYTLNSYIFTIEPNNGQEQQTQSVKFGQKPTTPTAPILTGYDFEAWYLDELFEKLFDINSFRMPAHNVTIYAKWKPSENTQITVYVYLENLDGTFNQTPDSTKTLTNTTNYYAEFNPVGNVIEVYTDASKQTHVATESGFTYLGFNLDVESSTISTTIKPDGSGEIVLYLLRNTYTVEFVYNNGQPNSTSEPVKYEQTINKPADPTRTGYVFAGWYLDEALTKAVTWPYAVTANVVMFAKWNSATDTPYTIEIYKQLPSGEYDEPIVEQHKGTTNHFVAVEKDLVWNLKVYTNSTKATLVGVVKSIEIEGYTFNQNGEVIEKTIAADGSMVIKLYYTLNSYIFTIEPNNGQEQQTQSVKFGQKPIMPQNPTRTGYVFDGWYLDQTFTTVFQLQSFAMPAHNVTIYAKWKPSENTQFKVLVFFERLDGSFNTIADIEKTLQSTTNFFAQFSKQNNAVEIFTDSTKQTKVAQETGFEYEGFELDTATSIVYTTVEADGSGQILLYFMRKTYTVEFVYNNGQPNSTSEPVKYEQTINKPADPTRTGYVFAGWHLDEALTKAVTWPYAVTANVVMYAKWNNATDTPYTIEIYKQLPSGEYDEPIVEQHKGTTNHFVAVEKDLVWNLKVYTNSTKATLVGVVKSIEIEGYTFNQNGEVIEKTIAADGSMVIKLYYTLNSYIFTIEPNNGQEQQTQSVKFGQKPIMPQNPTRTGYVFDGWYLDQTFTTVFQLQSFAMPAYDVSIYAKWAPAKDTPYAIEYYLEELDGTYPTHPNHTQHLVGTTNQYLEIEDWLLNVYQTAAKGAVINTQALQIFVGFSYSIEFESVHSASIAPDGTTALKVYLSRNHYALTLVYNNGQINKIITGVLFEQVVTEPVPTRQGYDFEGWYYDEDLTVKAPWTRENGNVSYVMEASDVTMYARWTARNDTPYSVEHYVENANDSNFTLHETKQYTGVTQTEVLAQTQTYAGFVFDQSNPNNITKGIVAADGTLVLKLYYTRQTYSLVFDGNGNTSGQMAPMQFKYGQTLALNQNSFARSGYNFIGWTDVAIGLVVKHTDKADFTFNKTSEITLYALWSIKPLDQATLTSSKPNPTINYGNTLVLTASAMHGADATTSYEWYYNGSLISHSGSTLEITEINQSGTYFVNIVIQGAIGQGAQSNKTSKLTSEIQVQVLARPIEIVFGQTNFVFNASHQSPTYNLRYVDNEDIEQPTRIIGFPAATAQLFAQSNLQTQTVNAGEYELQITLAKDDNFELIGAQNTTYTIEALEWNITSLINVGEFSKQYNYPPLEDPELSKALINPQTSEQITVYFEREAGEQIGVYDLILLPNQNTNYLITLDAGNKGFSILKSSQGTAQIGFKDLSLLTKVYDGQKINTNTPGFAIENLTASFGATIVDATFEIRNNNKNVGTYEIVLLSATTLEFANAELDAQYFFVITQRELQYVETDITKTYDGTKLFGHINFSNMVAEDQGFVDVIGMFASADVGTSIGVVASLDGSAKSNYKLGTTFANLVGTIVQRQVKVYAPTNIKIEYGSELPELTYQIFAQNLETGEFDQPFDASQATGSLKLTPAVGKLVVGTYLIEIGTITVSNNYTIVEYIGATLEVTPKSVSAIADWNKIYDGNTQFDKPIELVGILAQDDVEAVAQYATEQVGQNITITIELVGQDAPNYTLQNTSASGSITYHYVTAILDYQFEALATSEHSAVAETSLNLIYNKAIKESGYASLPVPTAVGYTFIGWYDQIENGNLFTKDTVISESNWPKDQAEKTLYARWDVGQVKLTVGVVTYSSKTYIIEDMSVALTGGTFTIDGVDYAEGGNMKVATFQTKVVVEAIAAQNYDFVGWFASPAADATPISKDSVFSPSGSILTVTMNNNITVYAKFKLKTATITLMANSNSTPVSFVGEFTNWNVTLGNGIASVSQQFDMLTTISLPTPEQVSRTGYQLLGWYPTQNPPAGSPLLSGEYTLIANTVLYAVWQSNTYTATFVASTGDEDPELLNADKGSFENPTNPLEPGVLTQQVEFEKPIGQIQTPTRIGYTFDGWYDNPEYSGQPYTQDSTYNFAQNHSFYAKWKQNTYTVTITVANSKGGNITVEQTNGVLNVEKQNIGANQIITVSLLTGSTLKLVATSTQGHQISFVSDYQNGVDLVQTVVEAESSTQVELSRFVQNISVQFAFLAQLHKVEIEVENTLFGSISATVQNMIATQIRTVEQDDTQRVEDNTTGSTQKLTVWAFTGETIKVQITPNAGYQTIGLLKTSGNGELSALVDRAVTYSNFSQNSALTVLFEEQTHSIVVKVGKDMTFGQTGTKFGSFGISVQDDQGNITTIESNSQNNNVDSIVLIKTNQKLILHINANNGFVVSQTAEHYLFETQFAQDTSSFDLSDIANGTLVFENFVSSGQIVLPFERNVYSMQIQVALFDENTFTIVENPTQYANVQILTEFDKDDKFYFEQQINLDIETQHGYEFVGWFGLLQESDMLSNLANYQGHVITQNQTIYAVVQLATFAITYEAEENGFIDADQLTNFVKFGKDGPVVNAVAFQGYEFYKWQILNPETQEWEDDLINTQATRQEIAVSNNMTIRAVFAASAIEVTILSQYIIDRDENGDYVFAPMHEGVGTLQIVDLGLSGITFVAQVRTGNVLNLLANANQGYSIRAWTLSTGTNAIIEYNDGLKDISIKGFKENFTITALFEANENIFEIAVVKMFDNNFNFNNSQFVEGGAIDIDPRLYLNTQPYRSRVMAVVRTEHQFDISYFVYHGYNIILDPNDPTRAMIGIRYEDEQDVVFVESVSITDLMGVYAREVSFTMQGFRKGGTIVLFVEEQLYDVTFHKTETEQAVFKLKINSGFTVVDSDYRLPSRYGYLFDGWYSQPNGAGVKYIDNQGVVLREWSIEHPDLYANWLRAYVTINIEYVPGKNIADGPLGWNVRQGELKRASESKFEYYVGINTYFEAPDGIDGYRFSHWLKGNEIVSTQRHYYFSISEDEALAEYTLKIVYSVRVSVQATQGGTAKFDTGETSKYLLEGQKAYIVATPNDGYEFLGWRYQNGQDIISTQTILEVSYSSTASIYTAVFAGKKVEINIQNGDNGTVDGWLINGQQPVAENGKYYARYGDVLTFTTTPQIGYVLTGWLVNGAPQGNFDNYQVTLTDVNKASISFKPVFSLIVINYEILFGSSGEVKVNNQKINSGKVFTTNYYGYVTFLFNPTIRYQFKRVLLNGTPVSEDYITQESENVYSINLPGQLLSLTSVNKFELEFDKIFWLDVREAFSGIGTEQNPYLITSAQQFAQMAYLINNGIAVDSVEKVEYASAYYLLSVSVDFEERFWVPIGTQENPFDGVITLEYSRRNIVLDKHYPVTNLDGLFGYITDRAKFIQDKPDISTAIIVFSSVGGTFVIVAGIFVFATYRKRKRLKMQSRIFPTDRPTKR